MRLLLVYPELENLHVLVFSDLKNPNDGMYFAPNKEVNVLNEEEKSETFSTRRNYNSKRSRIRKQPYSPPTRKSTTKYSDEHLADQIQFMKILVYISTCLSMLVHLSQLKPLSQMPLQVDTSCLQAKNRQTLR